MAAKRCLPCLAIVVAALTFVLVVALTVVFPSSGTAYAKSAVSTVPKLGTYSSPPWWNGTCDKGNNPQAYLLTTWRDIQVCGPLPGATATVIDPFSANGAGADQYEFMCTDLIARYIYAAYRLPSQIADGWQIVDKYTGLPNSPFNKVPNDGSIQMSPVEGDVLSYGFSDPGHTSIVTGSSVDSNGNGSINVIEQNVEESGTATLTMQNWIIQHDPNHIGTVANWMTTRSITSPTVKYWKGTGTDDRGNTFNMYIGMTLNSDGSATGTLNEDTYQTTVAINGSHGTYNSTDPRLAVLIQKYGVGTGQYIDFIDNSYVVGNQIMLNCSYYAVEEQDGSIQGILFYPTNSGTTPNGTFSLSASS